MSFNANQWVDENEIPYTHDPANPYNWCACAWSEGGRCSGAQSFRLSDFEFKAGDLEGTGQNWPVSLADMDPYYSRVEESFASPAARKDGRNFPTGISSSPTTVRIAAPFSG